VASSSPAPQPKELKQLLEQVQLERARVELVKLRSARVAAPARTSFRKKFFQWLIGGGALLTVIGTAADVGKGWEEARTTRHVEACKRAHEAITDDNYNKQLSEGDARKYMDQELRIVQQCNKDADL
jgi:hypothetical protein